MSQPLEILAQTALSDINSGAYAKWECGMFRFPRSMFISRRNFDLDAIMRPFLDDFQIISNILGSTLGNPSFFGEWRESEYFQPLQLKAVWESTNPSIELAIWAPYGGTEMFIFLAPKGYKPVHAPALLQIDIAALIADAIVAIDSNDATKLLPNGEFPVAESSGEFGEDYREFMFEIYDEHRGFFSKAKQELVRRFGNPTLSLSSEKDFAPPLTDRKMFDLFSEWEWRYPSIYLGLMWEGPEASMTITLGRTERLEND